MTQVKHVERKPQHLDKRIPHPPIVPPAQWLAARKKLLVQEKELTRHYDRVNAERGCRWSRSRKTTGSTVQAESAI